MYTKKKGKNIKLNFVIIGVDLKTTIWKQKVPETL